MTVNVTFIQKWATWISSSMGSCHTWAKTHLTKSCIELRTSKKALGNYVIWLCVGHLFDALCYTITVQRFESRSLSNSLIKLGLYLQSIIYKVYKIGFPRKTQMRNGRHTSYSLKSCRFFTYGAVSMEIHSNPDLLLFRRLLWGEHPPNMTDTN